GPFTPCSCNTLAHLHITDLGGGTFRFNILYAPRGSAYDLYFANSLLLPRWQCAEFTAASSATMPDRPSSTCGTQTRARARAPLSSSTRAMTTAMASRMATSVGSLTTASPHAPRLPTPTATA